jgi:hypothetical protein
MERRRAEPGHPGEFGDRHRFRVIAPDPLDGLVHVREPAVGQADLRDRRGGGTGQQPPQDLPLDHRGEHPGIGGTADQPQQAHERVEQFRAGRRGADRRLGQRAARPLPGRQFQQQRGDRRGPQYDRGAQRRRPRARADEVAGHRQVGRDDQAVPGPMLDHAVAEQQPLAPLRHHDEQRLGERVLGFGRLHPRHEQPVDWRAGVRAGVPGDQAADLREQRRRGLHGSKVPRARPVRQLIPPAVRRIRQ